MARKAVDVSHYKGSKGRAIHHKSSYIEGLISVCLMGIKSRSACKCQCSSTTDEVHVSTSNCYVFPLIICARKNYEKC